MLIFFLFFLMVAYYNTFILKAKHWFFFDCTGDLVDKMKIVWRSTNAQFDKRLKVKFKRELILKQPKS